MAPYKTNSMRPTDAALVERFLGTLDRTGLHGHLAASRASEISEGTIRRWRAGDRRPVRPGTLLRAAAFVRRYGEGAAEAARVPQLLRVADHPEYVRRIAGKLTTWDRIAAVYAVAFAERFSPEELRELDQWRDDLLSTEGRFAAKPEAHGYLPALDCGS